MNSLHRHNVTRGKGIDRPLTVNVIVKQASLIVCLCVCGFFFKDILTAWSFH